MSAVGAVDMCTSWLHAVELGENDVFVFASVKKEKGREKFVGGLVIGLG